MQVPTVLDEVVFEFLHPDETNEALQVLSIRDPSIKTWEDWKWNAKRQVVTNTPGGVTITIDGVWHSLTQPAVVYYAEMSSWFRRGQRHRDHDQPACVVANGMRMWYVNGKLHRNPDNDQPAIIKGDGRREWFVDGTRHRGNDQPAIVYTDGSQFWFTDDKQHRDGDQPAVIGAEGTKEWFVNGMRHRDNKLPAVVGGIGSVRVRDEFWELGIRIVPDPRS